ncbi:MAG: chloride channel protein [Flavobacteriales bacterium]
MKKDTKNKFSYSDDLFKWLFLASLIGILSGSASAFFLQALDFVTTYREQNVEIIWFLPLGGLLIGFTYHYWGRQVARGNNQLVDEFKAPNKKVPFIMAPLVLFGTLITHLFGGSAGREGTAVQMSGAIADQFSVLKDISLLDRKILLITGVAAGFSSVFGTPLAGIVFALEVLLAAGLFFRSLFPLFITSFSAHYVCLWWGAGHTEYPAIDFFEIDAAILLWTAFAGVLFGFAAFLFSAGTRFFSAVFAKIAYAPIRPLIAGVVISVAVYLMHTTKYVGLGIPIIEGAFLEQLPTYDFLIKILFTAFTLGAGFKGGEVTPLFFVGATLGNALFWFVPLPLSVLVGMGFVAVFAGATHTPVASTVMGMELFGYESWPFLFIACFVSYLFSGRKGIYSSQSISYPKAFLYKHLYRLLERFRAGLQKS